MNNNTVSGIDLPHIPDDLLAALEARFPDRCPDITDPERMIWFKAGQRSVIAILADQARRQKETDALMDVLGHVGARY